MLRGVQSFKKAAEESKMGGLKKLFTERTSLDGVVLIGIGVVILWLGPLAKIAAWGAIIYGAWTLFKSEKAAL